MRATIIRPSRTSFLGTLLLLTGLGASCAGEPRAGAGDETARIDTAQSQAAAAAAPRGSEGEPSTDPDAPADDRRAILFLGNSLTAGLGVLPDQAFPALIQMRLDSARLGYRVINAGINGDTSAGGASRIDWLLEQPVGMLVLELGANDALRGQDLEATRANLQRIIDRTRESHPDVKLVIAGMRAPPNLGAAYADRFQRLFHDLADDNGGTLIPFLLDGVAGLPDLNQPDGIHPTAEGHEILAANAWPAILAALRSE